MRLLLSSLLINLFILQNTITNAAKTTTTNTNTKKTPRPKLPFRERNLDHWDAETLAAHLNLPITTNSNSTTTTSTSSSSYIGHDAAILFYATWCPNCRSFAPSWDAISIHLHAGTTKSNLIMALFDCEYNGYHMALCSKVGITHYPSVVYIGRGPYRDSDFLSRMVDGLVDKTTATKDDKKKKKKKKKRGVGSGSDNGLEQTVFFRGNWNYPQQVMDWLGVMRGISEWNRVYRGEGGWVGVLRERLFGWMSFWDGDHNTNKKKQLGGKDESLPVGVPPSFRSAATATTASSLGGTKTNVGVGVGVGAGVGVGGVEQAELKKLENQLKSSKSENDQYKKAVTHASYVIDAFLFPITTAKDDHQNTTSNQTSSSPSPPFGECHDIFSLLYETNGWDYKYSSSSSTTKSPFTNKSNRKDGASLLLYNNTNTNNNNKTNQQQQQLSILRSCTIDLSLDYCTRLSTIITTDYLDTLSLDDPYPSLSEMERKIANLIGEYEPYCAILDGCYERDFDVTKKKKDEEEDDECRPKQCPFENNVACRYLGTCLDGRVMEEYEVALDKLVQKKKKKKEEEKKKEEMKSGVVDERKEKDVGGGGGGGGFNKKKRGWGVGA